MSPSRWQTTLRRRLSNPLVLHITHPSVTDSSFSSGPTVESPGFLPNDPFQDRSPSPISLPARPSSPIPPGSSDDSHSTHVPEDWGMLDPDSSEEGDGDGEEPGAKGEFTSWKFPLTPPPPPRTLPSIRCGTPSPMKLDESERLSFNQPDVVPLRTRTLSKARSSTSLLSRATSPSPSPYLRPSTPTNVTPPTTTSTLTAGFFPSSAIASALLIASHPIPPQPSSPPPPPATDDEDLVPPPSLRVVRKVRSLTSLLLHATRPSHDPPRPSTSTLRPRASFGDLFKRTESAPTVPTTRTAPPPPRWPLQAFFSTSRERITSPATPSFPFDDHARYATQPEPPRTPTTSRGRPTTPSMTPTRFSFASLRGPPSSPTKTRQPHPSGSSPPSRSPLRGLFCLHPTAISTTALTDGPSVSPPSASTSPVGPSSSPIDNTTPTTPASFAFSERTITPTTPTATSRVTFSRAAAKLLTLGGGAGGGDKPLPTTPVSDTSPRGLMFRDEDVERPSEEGDQWIEHAPAESGSQTNTPTRARLDGVNWGTRTVGIEVRRSEEEGEGMNGAREWDAEKRGVQVDGRW